MYDIGSSAVKAAWCVHAQSLAVHADKEVKGCGESLPWFMYWFSWALLLHVFFVVPLTHLGMALAVWAARSGLLATTRGAKPGTLEAMQVIPFNPELFSDPADPGDDRPQRECCICLDEFSTEEPIIKTPCQHFMHQRCLARWLQTSHVCPICRGNLEEGELL